jgi:hypothetical protein
MKQAIKVLSLAVKILWVLVIIFSITAVYSATNLRVGFGESKTFFSDGIISLSIPLFINNTGFYEIADLNITTYIGSCDNKTVSTSSTLVSTIPPSHNIQKTHNITLDIENLTRELPHLAFNDSVLDVHTFVALKFANVIPIQISTNATMPWGAPLYNFFIGEISFEHTQNRLVVPLSFENHAVFSINGTMRFEVYNSENEQVSTAEVMIDVLPGLGFEDVAEIVVDPSKLTHEGQVQVFFETSAFSIGPIIESWMIP